MTNEEKKAIEYFTRRIKNVKTKYTSIYFKVKYFKMLLNLIEKQDEMINLMAEDIFETTDYEGEKIYNFKNKQEIKEYFRKRVEEDAKN